MQFPPLKEEGIIINYQVKVLKKNSVDMHYEQLLFC